MTINQLIFKRYLRILKKHRCRTVALMGCPQKKGTVMGVYIVKPKKPNSAKRFIIKIKLSSKKVTRASIPGPKHGHGIKQYSRVLIRGGRIRDIIGLRYKVILGIYDAKPFENRKTSRSKYGVRVDHYAKLLKKQSIK